MLVSSMMAPILSINNYHETELLLDCTLKQIKQISLVKMTFIQIST